MVAVGLFLATDDTSACLPQNKRKSHHQHLALAHLITPDLNEQDALQDIYKTTMYDAVM